MCIRDSPAPVRQDLAVHRRRPRRARGLLQDPLMSAPFQQLHFAQVPDEPRLPHPYFDTRTETLRIDSRPFGPVDVHVRIHGSGPPLLLVHGFMTSSYSWRYCLEPLGRHFTLYMPDLVGSGRSSKPDCRYGPDALADSIGETI